MKLKFLSSENRGTIEDFKDEEWHGKMCTLGETF